MRRALLLSVMMVVTVFSVTPMAAAAPTTGFTGPLVNTGQEIRDSSHAVPIFGFSANGSAGTDRLNSIRVIFSGSNWQGGAGGELASLVHNEPWNSGVALYEDTSTGGGNQDALDNGDTGVNFNSIAWTTSAQVDIALDVQLPGSVSGLFHYLLVIRTSEDLADFLDGETITALIPQNGIGFSGGVSQPLNAVSALPLTARPATATGMLGPETWIGPSTALVNSLAVEGVRIVDGGIAFNHGIGDNLAGIMVCFRDNGGGNGLQADDFRAPNMNPSLSGAAVYWDDNPANDRWDPSDTAVVASGASGPNAACGPDSGIGGSFSYSLAFMRGPNTQIPDATGGAYNLLVIARTLTPETGDRTIVHVDRNMISTSSLLTSSEPNHLTVMNTPSVNTLVADSTLPCFIGIGGGCPGGTLPNWNDPTNSPYVHALNANNMYFSHLMTSPQTLRIRGQVSDANSGLGFAFGSNESPSLASNAAPNTYTGQSGPLSFALDYAADQNSVDAASPAQIGLFDMVGNLRVYGTSFNYFLDDEAPLIVPDPGWRYVGNQNGFWIDGNGKMWFSDWFYNTVEHEVRVDLYDGGGSGLGNYTATEEPSLEYGYYNEGGGCNNGLPAICTLNSAGFQDNVDVRFGISTHSTNASDGVDVVVRDNVGNSDSGTFWYGEDNEVPVVSITTPMMGDVVSGRITLGTVASDALTAIATCDAYVDASNEGTMFWNGTHYIWPVSTGLFGDGLHLLKSACTDMVGNQFVAIVQVSFANAPPQVMLTSPVPDAMVGGILRVEAATSTGARVSAMELSINSGTPVQMAYDSVRNLYWHDLDTAAANLSGRVSLTVRGWSGGTAGPPDTVWITVDNNAPKVSIISPAAGAEVSGIRTVKIQVIENVRVDSVMLSIGGAQGGAATYNPSSGLYEFDWATGGTQDGKVNLSAEAMDAAGNKGTGGSADVLVDNAAPSLLPRRPADRGVITGKYLFEVDSTDGTGSGFDGIGGVWMRVDSGPWMAFSTMLVQNPWWELEVDVSSYADGVHDISLLSRDDAGNEATGSLQVTMDSTPPMAAFLSPAAGSPVAGTTRLEVSALDTIGVRSVSWGSGNNSREFTRDPETGRWVYMFDTRTENDGDFTIEVTATDWAGLSSKASVLLKLDNSGPDIDPVGTSSKDGWVTITVKVTDMTGVESVEALVEGKLYAMVPAGDGTYSVSAPVSPGGSEDREYEVRSTDSLGNAASHRGTYKRTIDYWAALVNATPFMLFMLLLVSIIVFFILFRKGKLGAWWHKYEQAKMENDEGPAPLDVSKSDGDGGVKRIATTTEAGTAGSAPKSTAEIEKDERG